MKVGLEARGLDDGSETREGGAGPAYNTYSVNKGRGWPAFAFPLIICVLGRKEKKRREKKKKVRNRERREGAEWVGGLPNS